MHTQELLSALAIEAPGIEMQMTVQVGRPYARVVTLYEPQMDAVRPSLFAAAFAITQRLLACPNCPTRVREALVAYDQHTRLLQV